jgi:hypothetical protein
MLAEPRWFYDAQTKTMVINLIKITSTDIMSKEGIGTVRMRLVDTNYYPIPPITGGTVEIDFTPDPGLNGEDYSVAWDNYIMKIPGMTRPSGIPGSSGPIKYELSNVDKLVIKEYEVKIEAI